VIDLKVAISEVAEINPRLRDENKPELDSTVSFVPMAAVSEITLTIEEPVDRPYKEVAKGFTSFKRGDIIVAKITPCFENGKMAYADNLPNDFGFGSTEFHVMRPKSNLVGGYLFHLLREPFVRKAGEMKMKGAAGQRRVPADFFANLQIPLPPLEEQKRIAEILDAADALRAKRREALAKLDDLLQSTFLDMFGDPVTNPKGWEVKKMGEIMRIRRGGSPRPIDKYLGGTINWIKIGDATRSGDELYITSCAEKITENGLNKTTLLEPGSFVFANSGVSLGFARILKVKGAIHDGWLAFDKYDEELLNELYFLKTLNGITEHFRRIAPSGTQPNLNTNIMKSFNLILPPIDLQRRFAKIVTSVEEQKAKMRKHLEQLDDLFASLQQRAFRGDL
jgi:type I restriction enzyme S subunit